MQLFASLKNIGKKLKQELDFYKRILKHSRTPQVSKILLGAAIAYALFPIDLIPDFIPIIGHLDDIIIIPLLIWGALKFIPSDVLIECKNS